MKAWLKGGLIGSIITFVILFFMYKESLLDKGWLSGAWYILILILIIGFVIGSLIALLIIKNWSYWIKGGIWGSIIGLLFWAVPFSIPDRYVYAFSSVGAVFEFLVCPLCHLINLLLGGSYMSEGTGWFILLYGHFLNIILFFIIGALIGWIIGKRKSKQQLIQTRPQIQTE